MQILNKQELLEISGGFNLTGVLINSFCNAVNAIVNLGRSLGSSIRRISGNKYCKL